MSLFPALEGVDYSLLQQPIAKAKYKEVNNQFAFDYSYTQHMLAQLADLEQELIDQKRLEEMALADEKKKAEEEEKQRIAERKSGGESTFGSRKNRARES